MFTWSFLLVLLLYQIRTICITWQMIKRVSSLGSLWNFSPYCLSMSLLQHTTTMHSFPIIFFSIKHAKVSWEISIDSVSVRMTAMQFIVTETPGKCVTVNSPIVFTGAFKCRKHVSHLALVQSLPSQTLSTQ